LGASFKARPRDAILLAVGIVLIGVGIAVDDVPGVVLIAVGAACVFLGLLGERLTELKVDKSGLSLKQDLDVRDTTLTQRFADADVETFVHFTTLFGIPATDADGLVQQALSRVYEQWPDIPIGWRNSSVFCELCGALRHLATPGPTTQAPGADVTDLRVRAAALDLEHRQAFLLSTVAMASDDDTARILGVTPNDVRVLLADIDRTQP
jgi:hypothetical protein